MSQQEIAAKKHITLQCQFCQQWNRIDAARAKDRPRCGKCTRPMLLDRPYPASDENFERTVQESEIPVLVDFYADWCGPCKMMAPAVDSIAAKNQGSALVLKLNTDFNQKIAQQFQIQGIPTTIVFRDGKIADRKTGALPETALAEMLKSG